MHQIYRVSGDRLLVEYSVVDYKMHTGTENGLIYITKVGEGPVLIVSTIDFYYKRI